MKYTENLNLNKPDRTDFYNVEDFNKNMDILDAKIKEIEEVENQAISHISTNATDSTAGHVKLSNSSAVTDSTGLALPATEKNASINGTLAYQINTMENRISGKLTKTISELPISGTTNERGNFVTTLKKSNAIIVCASADAEIDGQTNALAITPYLNETNTWILHINKLAGEYYRLGIFEGTIYYIDLSQ